jgi:hypothetical protein
MPTYSIWRAMTRTCLPGVDQIPQDFIRCCKPIALHRIVHGGLNHEMGRELLWLVFLPTSAHLVPPLLEPPALPNGDTPPTDIEPFICGTHRSYRQPAR